MKNEIDVHPLFYIIIVGALLLLLCVSFGMNIPIKKKSPITPTLLIEIKNGVSDTTYIYKR